MSDFGKDNVGGAAFPTNNDPLYLGMSLRDYFAAKAMQADMIAGVHEHDFPQTAARSYKMADAMLKAREV